MPALIEVKLTELSQLFNSMDPAPFHERDLDRDAEEFIVSWAQEHPSYDDLHLVIHLARAPADVTQTPESVKSSVQHYFDYRAVMLWREFRQLMKEGRLTLVIGLVFMIACEFAALMLFKGDMPLKIVAREGLTILGWVAMWRPIEIYLYRWWPLLGKRRLYQRLARMDVELLKTSP